MRKILILFALLLTVHLGFSQESLFASGYLRSDYSGIPIKNAHIFIASDTTSAFTDENGYFSIALKDTSALATVHASGYIVGEVTLSSGKDMYHIGLEPLPNYTYNAYKPVTITNGFIYDINPSKINADPGVSESVPYIFSEPDAIKALQIHPGVEFAADGLSDLVVRGGGLGQNQILLDGAPVYGLGHLLGFTSNFSTNMVKDITIYKGAFPARYGGRLASVIEVNSDAGNTESTTVRLAATPMLANLNIGLPLGKNGSSVGVSLRRSYIDLLLNIPDFNLVARDFNTHMKLVLNDKTNLDISYFSLRDRSGASFVDSDSNGNPLVSTTFGLNLINRTSSARLQRIHSKQLTGKYTLQYSQFINSAEIEEQDFQPGAGGASFTEVDARFSTGVVGLNADYTYLRNEKSIIRFGLQNKIRGYNSGSLVVDQFDSVRQLMSTQKFGDTMVRNALEMALYAENELKLSGKLKVNLGFRGILYSYNGFTNFYFEPRAMGRYLLNKNSSLKLSYTRVNQFAHLYNTDGGSTDFYVIWLPAGNQLKPQSSHMLSFGYSSKLSDEVQFVSEVYAKTMANQPIFYAADLFNRRDMEGNALVGDGRAFGWENSIKYTKNRFMAYASLTTAVSSRRYEELNRGEWFSYDYDRRFIGKGGLVYAEDDFILSATGVYATGNPYTLPTAKYRDIEGNIILAYDEINNYRSTPHTRVDVKGEWYFSDGVQSIELMIYNVLGARNVSSIYSQLDSNSMNQKYVAYTRSQFSFFPFITYRLRIE